MVLFKLLLVSLIVILILCSPTGGFVNCVKYPDWFMVNCVVQLIV